MSDVSGVIVRGNRVTIICDRCSLFVKHDDAECIENSDPNGFEQTWTYVHRGQCPKKSGGER